MTTSEAQSLSMALIAGAIQREGIAAYPGLSVEFMIMHNRHNTKWTSVSIAYYPNDPHGRTYSVKLTAKQYLNDPEPYCYYSGSHNTLEEALEEVYKQTNHRRKP